MEYAGSYYQNIPEIMDVVKRLKPSTVLDIGCGSGKYGEEIKKALPNCEIHGIEGYEGYKNPMWDNYNEVKIKDVRNLEREGSFEGLGYDEVDLLYGRKKIDQCVMYPGKAYDLYLLIDIIEHLSKEDAFKLLDKIPQDANIIISIPWDYDQHDEINPLQNHISKWNFSDFSNKWQNFSNQRSLMLLRSNDIKIEDFSAVVIVKNEEMVLERLLKSLKGVRDIIIYDTGSTDKTEEIALKNKCLFIREEKSIYTDYDEVNKRKIFNFSKARNLAADYASNDFCLFPDADEIVSGNFNEIRKILPNNDVIKYRFCFSHDTEGKPILEFTHTKLFRKSVYNWTKVIHEIAAPIKKDFKERSEWTKHLYIDHWQNKKTDRKQYLYNLEYAARIDPDPRNIYYLAREYYYYQEYDRAIEIFNKFFTLQSFSSEVSQAYIYMGECYGFKGNEEMKIECFMKAMAKDNKRREPFYALASHYKQKKDFHSAILYYMAAIEIPYNPNYYLNNMELYTWRIYSDLALCFYYTGQKERAKEYYIKTAIANPNLEFLQKEKHFYFPEGDK